MTISSNLQESLSSFLTPRYSDAPGLNYIETSNVAPVELWIDCSGDTIEIPNFLGLSYGPWNSHSIYSHSRKLVVKLPIQQHWDRLASADAIIRNFHNIRNNSSRRLYRIITRSGEIYYGNDGLILDSEFRPLILTTTVYSRTATDREKKVVHLHPQVFLDDTKVVNRLLAKKGMSFFLQNASHPEIKIDGSEGFFHSVVPNKLVDPTDINNFLEANVADIVRQFSYDRNINESS